MALARHGDGPRAVLAAYASQIHPVFMLPPLAASGFGGILTGRFTLATTVVHIGAVFCAVYTAHVKDGFIDFHVRGEDDDHPLTITGCKVGLVAATVAFFGFLGVLWWRVGLGAALITLPCWLIGYHHAPQLDTNPITATTGYPLGIGFAITGGYYVQMESLTAIPLAFATIFIALLSGVKVIDDAQDFEYDRAIDKHTVAVTLGLPRARYTAYGLMAIGLAAVIGFAASGVFPPATVLAVAAFAAVASFAVRADPPLATMLLIRGSYVFLALLIAAVWFRPLT